MSQVENVVPKKFPQCPNCRHLWKALKEADNVPTEGNDMGVVVTCVPTLRDSSHMMAVKVAVSQGPGELVVEQNVFVFKKLRCPGAMVAQGKNPDEPAVQRLLVDTGQVQ